MHALLALALALAAPCPTPAPFHHPHDVINAVALAPGYPADPTVFCASAGTMNLFLISRNGGFSWVNARSGMRGFEIAACEVAPDWASSGIAYVALGAAGLQRTTDAGKTWDAPLVEEPVTHIAVGPVTGGSHVLYFAGDHKVWRSDDHGATAQLVLETPAVVTALALARGPDGGGAIAVGTRDRKLSVSRDRGATWSASEVRGSIRSLEFSPRFATDGTLWVCTYWSGLFRSDDGGGSFEHVDGLEVEDVNDIAVPATWPASRDLFVATQTEGVHCSRDGGRTWERSPLRIPETAQTDNHYRSVVLSPTYPEDPTVFCGSFEGLFTSNDGGENWYELNVDATHIGRKVQVSPAFERDGTVFATGYGNPLMASLDRGESWEMRSLLIKAMSTYSIGVSPAFERDGLVFVGVSHGLRRSTDGGLSWRKVDLEPVGALRPGSAYEVRELVFSRDFARDQVVYAVSEAGLFRSQDAGVSWVRRDAPVDYARHCELSPSWTEDGIVFIAGVSLRRSTDGGETWSEDLADGEIPSIRCAPDFAESGEAYAISYRKGFFRSSDHGATWTGAVDAFEGFSPSKLRLSPNFASDGTLYVATLSGGLFVSRDRGLSWRRMQPLGSAVDTCFDFSLSPAFDRDGTAFACTYDGILRTQDGGRTWRNVTQTALYDDLRDPWILRGGGWSPYQHERGFVFGGQRSRTAGDLATLPFTGTGVALYGPRGPDVGQAEILIDGERVATIDGFAPVADPLAMLYEAHDLPWAFHDLSVRVLGTRSPQAQAAWFGVDAAIVDYRGPQDGDVPVLARLEHIWLTPDASYGRDVRSETPPAGPGEPLLASGSPFRLFFLGALLLVGGVLVALVLRGRRGAAATAS